MTTPLITGANKGLGFETLAAEPDGPCGAQTLEEGATAIVRYAQIGPDGPTGGFLDERGARPW